MIFFDYLVIILVISFFSFLSLAPFVPTKSKDLSRILEISNLKSWEKFLEIGCWTARVSSFIAKNMPDVEVIWIELSPALYIYSKIKSIFLRQKNLKIIYWNVLNLDFWDYDVLYIFWMDYALKKKILPKFEKQWKETSKLISYCFAWENKNLKEKKYKKDNTELAIYEYKK